MRLILVRHAQSKANAEGRWQGTLDFACLTKINLIFLFLMAGECPV
jgi:broad specificity phosphatase PhoE